MRYVPYDNEYESVKQMTEAQLLEYFLTRVFEAEEVWGLHDGCDWLIDEDKQTMPIWPYLKFAETSGLTGNDFNTTAESLEDFVYQTLGQLMDDNIELDIMPSAERAGCLISPHQLYSILTGMIDAGEYTLDG